MIEDMEAELTEAPKSNSNTDNLAVTDEENVDEAITEESKTINKMEIYLKEEQKMQEYKKTITIYIENVNKILKGKQSIYNSMEENIRGYRTRF